MKIHAIAFLLANLIVGCSAYATDDKHRRRLDHCDPPSGSSTTISSPGNGATVSESGSLSSGETRPYRIQFYSGCSYLISFCPNDGGSSAANGNFNFGQPGFRDDTPFARLWSDNSNPSPLIGCIENSCNNGDSTYINFSPQNDITALIAVNTYEGGGLSSYTMAVRGTGSGCVGSSPPTSPPTSSPNTAPSSGESSDDEFLNSVCFSKENYVQVRGMGKVSIENVRVGDFVKTSHAHADNYSQVYSLAHNDKEGESFYRQITAGDKTIEISNEHLLFVDGKAKRAQDVKVGDKLGEDSLVMVKKIATVKRRGRYAPLTMNGEILVSDIKASSYVALLTIDETWQVQLYHAILTPLRTVCHWNMDLCKRETYSDGFSDSVFWLIKVGQVVGEFPYFVQYFLVVAISPVLVVVMGMDWMAQYSPALLLVAAWLGYTKIMHGSNKKRKNTRV